MQQDTDILILMKKCINCMRRSFDGRRALHVRTLYQCADGRGSPPQTRAVPLRAHATAHALWRS